ncbi:MAG TPA: polyphosphate kinase 2 family protein [Abditibacteriaceae bacterium]|jgi:PPK2 family polyphosphate:nucleotide phosphotransferase
MKNRKTALLQVKPGEKVRLAKIAADDTGDYKGKEESFERLAALQARLGELQERLYAEDKRSVLLVFQAMDTGGKDGAVKSLLTGINPVGVQVTSFKAPSQEELDHDYLWRVHQKVPGRGLIGVWNRSHYEDVLIVRVHKLIDKETAQARFEQINNFEKMLAENGVTILKFFLHISKDEQKERLQARLDNPEKHWKFNPGDLKERALWDDYQQAYEDVLNHCSTTHAPWHLVPADKKWARNIAVAEAVVAALEKMNPQFPKVDINPSEIVIE